MTQPNEPTVFDPPADEPQKVDSDALLAEVAAVDVGDVARTDDEKQLHRYVKHRFRLTSELTRLKDQMSAMIAGLENQIERVDFVLAPSAEQITKKLLAGGKAKSLKTPWGKVGFRAQQDEIEVVDDEAVKEQIIEGKLPEDIQKVKIEISKSALNKYIKESGDIPDGVKVTPRPDKFYVD